MRRLGDAGRLAGRRRRARLRYGSNINVDGVSPVSSEWPITVVNFLQARHFAEAVKLAKTSLHHGLCVKGRRLTPPPAWPALRARACGCVFVNGGEAC
jgi:hypothetical protein